MFGYAYATPYYDTHITMSHTSHCLAASSLPSSPAAFFLFAIPLPLIKMRQLRCYAILPALITQPPSPPSYAGAAATSHTPLRHSRYAATYHACHIRGNTPPHTPTDAHHEGNVVRQHGQQTNTHLPPVWLVTATTLKPPLRCRQPRDAAFAAAVIARYAIATTAAAIGCCRRPLSPSLLIGDGCYALAAAIRCCSHATLLIDKAFADTHSRQHYRLFANIEY